MAQKPNRNGSKDAAERLHPTQQLEARLHDRMSSIHYTAQVWDCTWQTVVAMLGVEQLERIADGLAAIRKELDVLSSVVDDK